MILNMTAEQAKAAGLATVGLGTIEPQKAILWLVTGGYTAVLSTDGLNVYTNCGWNAIGKMYKELKGD